MPEAYTHIRTARMAAKEMGMLGRVVPSSFCAGAIGPDLLFSYEAWLPADMRQPDMPALGERMHRERTGAFLLSLVRNAKTETQRSYAIGFICHYYTDCGLHPYVEMISTHGGQYDKEGGHAYFETALDCELHELDYEKRSIPVAHCSPRIAGTALAQTAALLKTCLAEVYGEDISLEVISDCFHASRSTRKRFSSRSWPVRLFYRLCDPIFGAVGTLSGHITPASPIKNKQSKGLQALPERWKNPFNGKSWKAGPVELLNEAARRTVTAWYACNAYWKGKSDEQKLAALLGSRSYITGEETQESKMPAFCSGC